MKLNTNSQLENDEVKFQIVDEILFTEFKQQLNITKYNVKEIIDLRHRISDNQKQYWCLDFNGIKSYSKEAQDYASEHGQEFLFACATIANTHFAKFMINFFLIVKKPKVPLKVFTQKEDAVKWLIEQKRLNEKSGYEFN